MKISGKRAAGIKPFQSDTKIVSLWAKSDAGFKEGVDCILNIQPFPFSGLQTSFSLTFTKLCFNFSRVYLNKRAIKKKSKIKVDTCPVAFIPINELVEQINP